MRFDYPSDVGPGPLMSRLIAAIKDDKPMRYEIRATANGHEVTRFVLAHNDAQAVSKFVADWTEHGDAEPTGIEITARWSQE